MCFDQRLIGLVQFFKCVEGTWILCMLRTNWLEWNPSFVCACAHCLNMVRLSLDWWNRHPVTRRPIRALKGWAAFILLGSTKRRSRCCWSKIILCEAPRICVRKAVFPPYVGSMVHLKTSHGQNRPRRAVLCNFRTRKKRRPVVELECLPECVMFYCNETPRLPAWVSLLDTCGSIPCAVDSQKIIVSTHTLS